MYTLLKVIFWSSVGFIALILVAALLLHTLPLTFATGDDEDMFDRLAFGGLPIAILLTLTKTIKRTETKSTIVTKTVLTVVAAIIPVLIAFATALGLCTWQTGKTLFNKKDDATTKIVLREFGCGAVDNTAPDCNVVEIKYITSHFMWISAIDTTTMDRTVWSRSE